jgi:hypothetical protein
MYSKPTIYQRSITIDITIVEGPFPIEPKLRKVACISISIDDDQQPTQHCFCSEDEHTLLNDFWASIRAGDLFISYDCLEADLSFVRERTWAVGSSESLGVDLQRFYSHELVNVMQLLPTLVPKPTPALHRVLRVLGQRRLRSKAKRTAALWASGDMDRIATDSGLEIRIIGDAYRLIADHLCHHSEPR